MIKGLSQIFSKKNKDINFLLPPEREQSNVFGFGERHTITIELKEELSKRHIEFNMDNIVKLTSSLLAIFYSKDETLVQEKNVKSLFLNSRIVPIITVKEKVSIFINPEDTEWHSIYWGTSGKGKSYFSSQMLTEQIKCCLTHYTYTLLNFMSENETNDNDLIQINFQNDWENFLDRIQRILLKS